MFGKQKEKEKPVKKVDCLNVYPKEQGGIKFEKQPENEISKSADQWLYQNDNKMYYLQKWDIEKNCLVPYYPLPEMVEVPPDRIGRMLVCPYTQLKDLKDSIWQKLAAWIPVIILVIGAIVLVVMGG